MAKISLAESHPKLALEADGWDPTSVTAGSSKKMAWCCVFNHRWDATIKNRTKGRGCPYCANRKILAGYNDLGTTHPKLALEADGWDPATVNAGSTAKLGWKCLKGHRWSAVVGNRSRLGVGCPYCSGNQVSKDDNDLKSTHPRLAAEADGWDPTLLSAGSNVKVNWLCHAGHRWSATVHSRVSGTGCPICSNQQVLVGYNDLATTHPDLAVQAVGWNPSEKIGGSHESLLWRCEFGHEWTARLNTRALRNLGCPICSNQQVLVGYNDLATTHPDLAVQAVGWNPSELVAGTNKRRMWRCEFGHEWTASVASRALNKLGCPICSNKQSLIGFNDLATTHPELASQAIGWDPSGVIAGTPKNHRWRCELGHEWTASPSNRSVHGTGCPVCAGREVLAGFNDLKTTNPILASEALNWDPSTVTEGSHRKVRWRCEYGHEWTTSVKGRKNSGCPSCAKTGFDPNVDGWLYFLRHEAWGLLQIGISNIPKQRLSTHAASGWELIELRGPMEGQIIHQWEQAILAALRSRGVPLRPDHIAGRFSGYTESWIQEDFPASSLTQLMGLVYDDEA